MHWPCSRAIVRKDEDDPPYPGRWTQPRRGLPWRNTARRRTNRKPARMPCCSERARGQPPGSAITRHLLTENRHGLIVDVQVTQTTGTAAIARVEALTGTHRCDGGRGQELRHETLRGAVPTPHPMWPKTTPADHRPSTDAPPTIFGYRISQTTHKRAEEYFDRLETIGGVRKSWFARRDKLDFHLVLGAAAHNLVRMRNPKVAAFHFGPPLSSGLTGGPPKTQDQHRSPDTPTTSFQDKDNVFITTCR